MLDSKVYTVHIPVKTKAIGIVINFVRACKTVENLQHLLKM